MTKTEFYTTSGYSSTTVNDSAVNYFLATFQELLEEQLGYVFSLHAIAETDKFNYFTKNSESEIFIKVGAWQEVGLTVKLDSYNESETDTLATDPLIIGEDYLLFRFKTGYKRLPSTLNKDNPVVAIKLLKESLTKYKLLRLYGTWGFSNGLPTDLDYILYTALKNAIEYNGSTTRGYLSGSSGAGGGAVQSIKTYTTSVMFSVNVEAEKSARNYFLDFLNSPNIQNVINKYTLSMKKSLYMVG